MDYFFHIKPTFNCLAKLNNTTTEMQENKIYTFSTTNYKDIIDITFYPLDKDLTTSLPYLVSVSLEKEILYKKNDNVNLIIYPKHNYLLLAKPLHICKIQPFNIQSKTISFAKIEHTLYWNKNDFFMVRIENSTLAYIDLKFPKTIININTKTCEDKLFIYAKTTQNTYIVALITYENFNYLKEFIEEVDLLENNDEEIKTYKFLYDISKHGYTKTYKFSPTFSQKTNLVLSENDAIQIKQRELIPFAFFDAIKVENFDLARLYLSTNLSKKLDDIHLKKFFSSFLFPHQTLSNKPTYEEIALIYKTNQKYYAKIFKLVINNVNKIENIIELDT